MFGKKYYEFGHILQYRIVEAKSYYGIIAKESLASATLQRVTDYWNHDTFWTETWANHLSSIYFNTLPWDYVRFPTKDINMFNLYRLIMYNFY
jgi:hypothetical protein